MLLHTYLKQKEADFVHLDILKVATMNTGTNLSSSPVPELPKQVPFQTRRSHNSHDIFVYNL